MDLLRARAALAVAAITLLAAGAATLGSGAANPTPAGADPAATTSLPPSGPAELRPAGPGLGRAVPAWVSQARLPFPGGPRDQLNIWLAEGQAQSVALPHEHPAVLFVGDSITQWWRTNGRASWDRWFAPLGAVDDGVVADTTSNLLARLESGQVPRSSPRVIVLMIGTNNLALGQSPPEIVKGIEAVMSALHRRMPASRLVVLGLLPRGNPGDSYRAEAAEVNRLLSRSVHHWATRHRAVSYLDVGAGLLGPDGRFLPGMMLPDLLHPAPAGYARISGPILAAIQQG